MKAKDDGNCVWLFQNKRLLNSTSSKHFKFPDPLHYGIDNGTVLEIHRIQHRHSGLYKMTVDVDGCQNTVQIVVDVKKAGKGILFQDSFRI